MKAPKHPCVKDCPGRSPTCHASCEKYLKFAEDQDKFRNEIFLSKKADDFMVDGIWRARRSTRAGRAKYGKHGK